MNSRQIPTNTHVGMLKTTPSQANRTYRGSRPAPTARRYRPMGYRSANATALNGRAGSGVSPEKAMTAKGARANMERTRRTMPVANAGWAAARDTTGWKTR